MKAADKAAMVKGLRQRAREDGVSLWHDTSRHGWATVPVDGHRENWRIASRDFKLWATKTLWDIYGDAPTKQTIRDCIDEFETFAVLKSRQFPTSVRVAADSEGMYVDLANTDWESVQIGQGGWRLLADIPVKFRRSPTLGALPRPESGGKLRNVLHFLNIPENTHILYLAWLTYCLRIAGSYPVLVVSGVQGAGKSTLASVSQRLIDPIQRDIHGRNNRTGAPRSERDFSVTAQASHLLVLDNISEIKQRLSDLICRMSTGAAFRARALYTDSEEKFFAACRPIVINGIEDLPLRPDLLSRTIVIRALRIERRRDEQEFWGTFEKELPHLLGALYEAVAAGLNRLAEVRLERPPRMADFARWGVAIEEHLGYSEGAFMAAYTENIAEADASAVEASPVAKLVRDFLFSNDEFSGTALALLQALVRFAESNEGGKQKLVLKHPKFPRSASQLSGEIARVEDNLQKMGVYVKRTRPRNDKIITLRKSLE